MKILTTLLSVWIACNVYGQTGTIQVTAPCFGPSAINFSYATTVNGRNQYIDDDGDPNTNPSLRIAYNPTATRWEIQVINDPSTVFYATGTNTFAPDPPASAVATYSAGGFCTGEASVAGSGTQTTDGADPCADAGGDSDNDGVCDDADACPGSDDRLDRDGDGTPDGCDASFDGVAVTSDCFGGTLDFVPDGTAGTGRNRYVNTFQGFEIVYDETASRWEVRVISDPDNVFYTNTTATSPDPPASDFAVWTAVGTCTQAATVTGGGTQDYLCTLTCPGDIVVAATADSCDAIVNYDLPTAPADCGPVTATLTGGLASGERFPLGVTLVTYSVELAGGQTETCQFNVRVIDRTPPALSCLTSDPVVEANLASCSYTVADNGFDPPTEDACGAVTLINNLTNTSTLAGAVLPLGSTVVEWIARDAAGNETRCTSTIRVIDRTPPSLTCPADVLVQCLDDVPAPDVFPVVATDACSSVTLTYLGEERSSTGAALTITRTYRATDLSGNAQSCYQTITVADTEKPTLVCPPAAALPLDDNCSAVLPDYTGGATVNDNCDANPVVTQSPAPGTLISGPVTVTLTATDAAGNQESCDFSVGTADHTRPEIVCPADVVVACASDIPPVDVSGVTAADNCGTPGVALISQTTRGAECDYQILRTYRATDAAGNFQDCTQEIRVVDTIAPTFTYCPANSLISCREGIPAPETPTAVDNCGETPTVAYLGESRSDDCGADYYLITRSWSATDNCGNVAYCTQVIEVSTEVVDDCYALDLELDYDPVTNTTTFDWTLCRTTADCNELVDVTFSLPCTLPVAGVADVSTSQHRATYGVLAKGKKRCADYVLQFKNLRRGGKNNPQGTCTDFSYTLAGDFRDYRTDVKAKGSEDATFSFPAVGGTCGCAAPAPVTARLEAPVAAVRPTAAGLQMGERVQLRAFPNPASTDVTIDFALATGGRARLDVYTLTGVRVAALFDADTDAGSTYRATFARGQLPAGTYVYRLVTDSDQWQGRLVLLR